MKDCAFYYDVPTVDDEVEMKKKLQFKYDHILQEGWRPAVTSRRDLMHWACGQYNKTLEVREIPAEQMVNCDNHAALLHEFGPNYNRLKSKLGHVRGLFE